MADPTDPGRRALIVGSAGAVVVLGAGAAIVRTLDALGEPTAERAVEEPPPLEGHIHPLLRRIRRELEGLRFPQEAFTEFLSDYEENIAPGEVGAARDPDISMRFLLSTDFFENGQDESAPLEYVLFYDPWINPCRNPLVG